MDLAGLRVVRAVADTGSVSRAADTLNCVQSNVTARLKKLEEDLGTPLFHRPNQGAVRGGGRGMVPTAAGRVLADYADRILRMVEQARHAVDEAAGRGGRLAVGSMESTAAVRLPPLLARFHRAHPLVELTIVPGHSENLLADVLAYRLDGAFVGSPVVHPDLVAEPMFEEEMVLAGPASWGAGEGWPGGTDTPESPRVLLAFGRGCFYRARAEAALRRAGMVPFRVMEFGTLDAILGCTAAGMGMTVMPRAVLAREPWRGLLAVRPLPADLSAMPTLFVRRADVPVTGVLNAFLALVGGTGTPGGDEARAPTKPAGLQPAEATC